MTFRRFFGRRGRLVGILIAAGVLALGGVGWAYFTSSGSGNALASVGSLGVPANVNGTSNGSSVTVSWSGITDPGTGTFGYYVTRAPSPSGTSVNVCGSSPTSLLPATPTSCSDTPVPDGTYTYTVTAVYNSFSAASAPSGAVTVAAIPPTASAPGVTAAVTYGTHPIWVNSENVTLTDSPSTNGGPAVASISYYYCLASNAPCNSGNWTPIGTTTSGGTWSVTWASTSLPADQTYDVVATATNAAPLISPVSAATEVGVDTTPPTVSTPSVNGIS